MSAIQSNYLNNCYIIQNKLDGNYFLKSIKCLLNRIRAATTGRILIVKPGSEKMSFSTDYASLSTVDTSFIDYSIKAKKQKQPCPSCGTEKQIVYHKMNVDDSNRLYKFSHEQGLSEAYEDITYKNILNSKLPDAYLVRVNQESDDKNKRYIDTIIVISKDQIEKLRDGDNSFVSTQKVIKTAHSHIPKNVVKGSFDYFHAEKLKKAMEQRQAFIYV